MGFLHNTLKRIRKVESIKHTGETGKVTAVDVGQSHLLVVAVEKYDGKLRLSNFRLETRPKSSEAVSERLKTIFEEEQFEPKEVRTCIKTSGMVIRILTFPQMKRSELASMLQYEAEKYIPFKSSDVIIDFDVLEENIDRGETKAMEMLLVAVKRNEVYDLHKLFQNAEIQIDSIGIGSAAFANLIGYLLPETLSATIGFLDMGTETSSFGITIRGKPVFVRDISFGGADILKIAQRKMGLAPEKILAGINDASKVPTEYTMVAEQAVGNLLNELKLSLGYYMDHVKEAQPIETMFVAGGGFRMIPDLRLVEDQIKIPVSRPQLASKMDIASQVNADLIKQNEDLLPPVLGLCL